MNTRPPYLPPEKPVCRIRTEHGTTDLFKIGKGLREGYVQSTSCKMLDWMKRMLESRLPGEISATSDMWVIPP